MVGGRAGAGAEFKERLIASLGVKNATAVDRDGVDVLALSELGTYLLVSAGRPDNVPDSLTIRTPLAYGVSASNPDFRLLYDTLNWTLGLNRWTHRDGDGVLCLEASLMVNDATDDHLLRLAEFLLRSQVAETRAKLFEDAATSVGGNAALLFGFDGEYVWQSEDYALAEFIETEVRPFRERPDLWAALRNRSQRVLPVPEYAPYQGPGWGGVPTGDGWVVQLPWTSVARNYGVIEIRWDKLLNYSNGRTVLLDINYAAESPMWGSGLEMRVCLPLEADLDYYSWARELNLRFAVPTWTHGLGRFIGHAEGIMYSCFLPAYLGRDQESASWLFDQTLMMSAITMQELRPAFEPDDPVPHRALATSLAVEYSRFQ